MTHRIIPAIMSGGAGTRLWPLSTERKPKQFHALTGPDTLFLETLRRVSGQAGPLSFSPPIVLGNRRHLEFIETSTANAAAIVLEPSPRNTAAVAVIAAALAGEVDAEALVLLLPADHIVANTNALHAAIARAAPLARDRIVTFGIAPSRPATGYGYIKRGEELAPGVFAIEGFREKPDALSAETYLADAGYSWNSGMFLFHPRRLLEEFSASPEIRDTALAALASARRDGVRIHLDEAAFALVPAQPLDIAVMEETARGAVVPCDIGWADIGAWDEIWRLSPKDGNGNVVQGAAITLDAANSLIRTEGVKVYAAGVSDLVVVATPDAVLIIPRERAQDVKLLRELAAKLDGDKA
jgi:mannose-1-phosphate guanylyltransferase / mannose-6-phosphate isomerase